MSINREISEDEFELKVADFDFLKRKEFIIFCFFLLVLAFSQIALEKTYRISSIEPLLELNNSFLENLGLFLPFFTAIFLFLQTRTKGDYAWLPPWKYFFSFLIIFLLITFFPIPEPSEEIPIIEPTNNLTTTTPTSFTTPSTSTSSETSQPPNDDQDRDYRSLLSFFNEFRNVFILAILFFPLLFIFIIQRRSKLEKLDKQQQIDDVINDIRASDYEIRSILGCYYLASTVLEERGADDSPSFTPSEFNKDVLEKKLSSQNLISVLTDLFEEAKFSTHKIPRKKVEDAKSITSEIILASEPILDANGLLAESLVDIKVSELEEDDTD
ncbi:MAG: DUF4129 domain-containing protein [Candidatus Hodarchaeota archaeon]